MKLHRLIPGWNQSRQALKFARFASDYHRFRSSCDPQQKPSVNWSDRYPCLDDRTQTTGFDRHYIYHTAWASRVLSEQRPEEHVDIGSSLYFVTGLSAFIPVRFYDYRPAEVSLSGLSSGHADLTALPFEDRSIASLSCMHVVEHVGLGRYGDPIDPDAALQAMGELQRVVANDGILLFVTPVGRPRVCFNAHRVFSYQQVLTAFSDLCLEQFALIPDSPRDGGLLIDADPTMVANQDYACGCFMFRRKTQ